MLGELGDLGGSPGLFFNEEVSDIFSESLASSITYSSWLK